MAPGQPSTRREKVYAYPRNSPRPVNGVYIRPLAGLSIVIAIGALFFLPGISKGRAGVDVPELSSIYPSYESALGLVWLRMWRRGKLVGRRQRLA
jgi:hypothetical protein